jgi:type I restriction enzyme, S subunit
MNANQLLEHFHRIGDAPDAIPRLRWFILDLAVRGKLVPQDPRDEPTSELLKRINKEKARLLKAGEISKPPVLAGIGEAETPFALPSTWTWVRVADVFDYDAGTKRDPKELLQDRWLLELEDIEKDTSAVLERLRVSDRDSLSTKSEFEVGDILYGKLRPYLNKVVVADEPGYSTTEIVAIRPFLKLCPAYCALAFRRPDFVAYVERLGQGTKMPRLRTPDAIVAPFPLPPLEEQHRIVAKLDGLMALCDRLEAARAEREGVRDQMTTASLARLNAPDPNSVTFADHTRFALDNLGALTTRPAQIKQLRQTILNLAVRGKLVPQDPNDEPASELLKRIAAETARLISEKKLKGQKNLLPIEVQNVPFDVLNGWAWAKADDVFLNITDGFHNTPSPVLEGRPYVTAKHIRPNKIDFETCLYVDEKNHRELFAKTRVKRGDILIVNIGAGCGTPAMINVDFEFSFKNVAIVNLPSEMDGNFILLFLLYYRDLVFDDLIKGGAQPFLGLGMLREMLIPLPPLAEQRRIVAKVNKLMTLCDELEASLAIGDDTRRRLLDAILAGVLLPKEIQEQAA